ncbi:MAG TPA: 4Fe-4S dicluster domain-containing protein, partial [Spirochaetes bacterium]|nr:4Fe-4S dicluster domain-containing protein [Spirochaetota bacterium]
MKNNSVTLIYFSPTGTTRRVLEAVAEGIGYTPVETVDLTPPAFMEGEGPAIDAGCALIGVPVYAGRVPLVAVERLKKIRARNVPAVLVVLYGNRAFEDALLELKEISTDAGFLPVAGAAFIGEHSFAREDAPIALGRPDESDLARAHDFGRRIKNKLGDHSAAGGWAPLEVPGKVPYRERAPRAPAAPRSVVAACTLCGTCETVCPTGAVAVAARVETDPENCILCHACVKRCPTGARVMDGE